MNETSEFRSETLFELVSSILASQLELHSQLTRLRRAIVEVTSGDMGGAEKIIRDSDDHEFYDEVRRSLNILRAVAKNTDV